MAERRSPSSSSALVFQWLESIGLDYSVEHFRALGFDTPDKFAAFSLPDYDLVGVTDAEDRKRLFFLVQRVKMAVEERAKKKAEKQASSATRTLGRTDSVGRVINSAAPPTPSKPPAPAEGDAGLSRSMREQVLNVDLSAMHALDGGGEAQALHSGQTRGTFPPAAHQQQSRCSSLDDSALGISASATPSPFRHDVHIAATHATQHPPPPAYYLPAAASKQLSASATPGSSPFFASPASVLSSSTNAAVVASPEGPAAHTAGGRGLLSALGGASSHKRKTQDSAHPHQQTRMEGLVDMISDGPRDDMAIRVVVRKRPLTQTEKNRGDTDIIESQPPQTVVVNEPKRQLDLTPFTESHYFVFDHSFDHLTPNEQIYGEVCLPLVAAMFRGGRSTCFAYGQTGSGKTFTMMGSGSTGHNERVASGQSPSSLSATASAPLGASGGNSGLYELAAQDIFQVMAHPRFAARGWSLHVSFYEIYGGKLFDLLNHRGVVRCLEDAKQQVQFLGLSEKHVRNVEELLGIMAEGQRQRSTGSTAANADSSRSHAVLQLSLKAPISSSSSVSSPSTASPVRGASGKGGVGGSSSGGSRSTVRVIRESSSGDKGKQPVVGTFSFIDLAGSERGADTRHADKATRLEGAEINTSLLALKEVIRALDKKQTHTPFRGSKLTQVLKDSLVGANARTVMVACIAPSLSSCEHTLNTLRYADRVKEQDATQQQQQATAALSSTMNGTRRVPPSPAPTTTTTTTTTVTTSKAAASSAAAAPTQSTLTREGSFSPSKARGPASAAPTGAGNNNTRDAALASALEEAKEVQLYVQQLKELRSKTRQERSRSRSQSQSRLLHSLSSSSSSSAGSGGGEDGGEVGVAGEMDERQQQLEAYREATQCLLETHKHAHIQLLNHLREEVDLLHVMDGDRGNLEAYLDSVERLLEEQDQELERIQAHLEHVKAAKRTLMG